MDRCSVREGGVFNELFEDAATTVAYEFAVRVFLAVPFVLAL